MRIAVADRALTLSCRGLLLSQAQHLRAKMGTDCRRGAGGWRCDAALLAWPRQRLQRGRLRV